jgi:hypothetical protein
MSTARILRGLVLVFPLALTFALGACGSDDGDDGGGNAGTSGTGGSGGSSGNSGVDPRCRISACPNHADPYDTEEECEFVLGWSCLEVFLEYTDCIQAKETCGSDGRSDFSAGQCAAETEALGACPPMM